MDGRWICQLKGVHSETQRQRENEKIFLEFARFLNVKRCVSLEICAGETIPAIPAIPSFERWAVLQRCRTGYIANVPRRRKEKYGKNREKEMSLFFITFVDILQQNTCEFATYRT